MRLQTREPERPARVLEMLQQIDGYLEEELRPRVTVAKGTDMTVHTRPTFLVQALTTISEQLLTLGCVSGSQVLSPIEGAGPGIMISGVDPGSSCLEVLRDDRAENTLGSVSERLRLQYAVRSLITGLQMTVSVSHEAPSGEGRAQILFRSPEVR